MQHAVHCWADYQAAVDMRARSAWSLRRQLATSERSSRPQRRYSAGFTRVAPKTEDAITRAATLLEPLSIRYSIGGLAESFGSTFFTSMSRNLDTLLNSGLDQHSDGRPGSDSQITGLNYKGVLEEEQYAHNIGKTGDQR